MPKPAESIVKTEDSLKSPPSTGSDTSQPDFEDRRGRLQERERSSTAKAEDESGLENANNEEGGSHKPRKRKRSRKGLEKNFACPHPGCGKSYSRAEHLYRHQLNRVYSYNLTPIIEWNSNGLTRFAKTSRRRSTSVITQGVSADLYGKISAPDTRKDIQLVAHIYSERIMPCEMKALRGGSSQASQNP